MFCFLTDPQSRQTVPVYVHPPDGLTDLPLQKALHTDARIMSMPDIDFLYPRRLLDELDTDHKEALSRNATFPPFSKLTPNLQREAIRIATGEMLLKQPDRLVAWPQQKQDRATIMDMVAQQLITETIPEQECLEEHAS